MYLIPSSDEPVPGGPGGPGCPSLPGIPSLPRSPFSPLSPLICGFHFYLYKAIDYVDKYILLPGYRRSHLFLLLVRVLLECPEVPDVPNRLYLYLLTWKHNAYPVTLELNILGLTLTLFLRCIYRRKQAIESIIRYGSVDVTADTILSYTLFYQ